MDSGLTIRPITGQNVADIVRAPPLSPHSAVATELPAAKSVTAPEASSNTNAGNARPQTATLNNDVSHEVVIDPAVREVIYRVVDVSSGQVIRQVPDEALLRVRAYARALDKQKSVDSQTNRSV